MAKKWPSTLPDPLNEGMSITSGSTVKLRKLESGRYESRRFGDGMPDQLTCTFRLLHHVVIEPVKVEYNQLEQFNDFFEGDLNQGTNWFEAGWLSDIGYNSHVARFFGYPKVSGVQGYYYDLQATLLIQRGAWASSDTSWNTKDE